MKPLIQKLPLDEGTSFVARIYETPYFEVPWHQHETLELIVFNSSSGTALVGNHVGVYQKGDVFFFGKNLPHGFRKQDEKMLGNAMVIQFKEDFLGTTYLNLPEIIGIKNVMHKAKQGLKLHKNLKEVIGKHLLRMENQQGYHRLRTLIDCLHRISLSDEYQTLTNVHFQTFSQLDQDKIGLVFEYTMRHYKEKISIQQMAELTNLSASSFCKYFKRTTQKTYITFLNEVRIGQACKWLKESDQTISEICYACGFKSWANFSKQFKKIKGMPPREYRKRYLE